MVREIWGGGSGYAVDPLMHLDGNVVQDEVVEVLQELDTVSYLPVVGVRELQLKC